MARASADLVIALRNTLRNIESSTDYQWGHMGSCNCGFLAREITKLRKDEIHSRAMQGHGDWSEQLNDYCPTSGLPMDDLITKMLNLGLDTDDLKHLERLSSPLILSSLPQEKRNLRYNVKADVVTYLRLWISQLEAGLLPSIKLTNLSEENYEGLYNTLGNRKKAQSLGSLF